MEMRGFREKTPTRSRCSRFAERGLALPASDFFRGLLDYYKIEHVHLNPNEIFHTSLFVHFCEAFSGNPPTLGIVPEVVPGEATS